MKIRLLTIFIMFFNIVGCSSAIDSSKTNEDSISGYPPMVSNENKVDENIGIPPGNGYPVMKEDQSLTRTPIIIPTPSETTGVVFGRIMSSIDNSPITFTTIYLGEILQLSDKEGYLFTLQEKSSPHSESDKDGNFVIYDIDPGQYVILLFTPRKSVPIIDEENGKEVVIVIEPNTTLELPPYTVNWP